jgi:hypothetical protein
VDASPGAPLVLVWLPLVPLVPLVPLFAVGAGVGLESLEQALSAAPRDIPTTTTA